MQTKRAKLEKLLSRVPSSGAPFPEAGGISALAGRSGCSREYAWQVLERDYPELLARHRKYKLRYRHLCGRCGA